MRNLQCPSLLHMTLVQILEFRMEFLIVYVLHLSVIAKHDSIFQSVAQETV